LILKGKQNFFAKRKEVINIESIPYGYFSDVFTQLAMAGAGVGNPWVFHV
jgi:hypothetical protein